MDIKKVAETLKQQSYIFTCSYKTAWEQYMYPAITDKEGIEALAKEVLEDER